MDELNEIIEDIRTLIAKAAGAPDSADAMRFSQAATNAANAAHGVMALRNRNN
jgi:hypothetical protein